MSTHITLSRSPLAFVLAPESAAATMVVTVESYFYQHISKDAAAAIQTYMRVTSTQEGTVKVPCQNKMDER